MAEKRKGPYFFGEEFSLVDIAVAPWTMRDYVITEHRGYKREDVGGGWKEWADILGQRESVLKTTSVSNWFPVISGASVVAMAIG